MTLSGAEQFGELYEQHGRAILAYLRRRVPSSDADDLLAQVFLTAWRRFDQVPRPPEDRLWLFGVARLVVADHRRSTVRRRRLQARLARQPPEVSEPPSFGRWSSRVEAALGCLRPAEREVLRLVLWDGLSHSEASAVLECSANAVELRYRRARASFRDAFAALTAATRDPATRDPATRDPATRDPATRDPATRDPADQAACSGPVSRLALPTPGQAGPAPRIGAPTLPIPGAARAVATRAAPAAERNRGGPMPRALITGITGQDGRYLAELLIGKGYQVHGMVRGQSNPKAQVVQDEAPEVELIAGDLTDLSSLISAVEQVQPDEVYNLGAISFVKLSFSQPELTADVSGSGVLRMLEAVRIVGGANNRIRFYQAATSEMFGQVQEVPQRETTPFHPRSPYGTAKVFGYYTTLNYRESYGIHASNGILFNHTSPRRGLEFVERKITNAVARISLGLQDAVALGNIDTSRDFGYAGDYVEAMWRMLQQDDPGDYVVATGRTWSVRQVLDLAFAAIGIDDWSRHVTLDDRFLRPAEVDHLVGDASRAREVLGWEPTVELPQVIEEMVRHDLELERAKASHGGV